MSDGRAGSGGTGGDRAAGGTADFGVDAPYVPIVFGLVGIAGLVGAAIAAGTGDLPDAGWSLISVVFGFGGAVFFLHATRRGKFRVWDALLDDLALRGDERVLDVGCGRGAVLLAVAARLPAGRATGIDLWRTRDQSGNDERATLANAAAVGVGDRVELHTADITGLPFPDGSFDVVLSSMTVHNLPGVDARRVAVAEAVRVLRPGGRVVIVDIRSTGHYARWLGELGLRDVRRRGLGPGMWWSGPWAPTSVVTARRW